MTKLESQPLSIYTQWGKIYPSLESCMLEAADLLVFDLMAD